LIQQTLAFLFLLVHQSLQGPLVDLQVQPVQEGLLVPDHRCPLGLLVVLALQVTLGFQELPLAILEDLQDPRALQVLEVLVILDFPPDQLVLMVLKVLAIHYLQVHQTLPEVLAVLTVLEVPPDPLVLVALVLPQVQQHLKVLVLQRVPKALLLQLVLQVHLVQQDQVALADQQNL